MAAPSTFSTNTGSHAPDSQQQIVSSAHTDSIDSFDQRLITTNKTTAILDKENKIHVSFPFNGKKSTLHKNPSMALTQLKSQIEAKPTFALFRERYNDITQQQLKFGCIDQASKNKKPIGSQYYIPHQVVVKPDFSTTNFRIVLDASFHKENEQ
ncbi:hypothetical protein CRE_06329 [Caenorhabditis remanei]|uniref:Uncharacterized protein n=1 Tax=Caenorhabditis remanei TaxID=31234 RepID=E3M1G2_CAERE|nr:hypothetical protein CRE_06329 [Caenorhabditis remanei]